MHFVFSSEMYCVRRIFHCFILNERMDVQLSRTVFLVTEIFLCLLGRLNCVVAPSKHRDGDSGILQLSIVLVGSV